MVVFKTLARGHDCRFWDHGPNRGYCGHHIQPQVGHLHGWTVDDNLLHMAAELDRDEHLPVPELQSGSDEPQLSFWLVVWV